MEIFFIFKLIWAWTFLENKTLNTETGVETIISAMVRVKGEPQIQDRFCHRGKEGIIGLNKLTIIA